MGDNMKKFLFSYLFIIIIFLIMIFLITLMNYFDVLSGSFSMIFKMIIPIVSMLIGSIYLGRKSKEKGYLEGIKLGVVFVVVLFLFSFLGLDKSINTTRIIYYLIIIVSSMLGSMIGIQKNS